jgi:hypothetical protein
MRYRVIQEHDRRYPIRLMCRALAVSPAGIMPGGDGPRVNGWLPIGRAWSPSESSTMSRDTHLWKYMHCSLSCP